MVSVPQLHLCPLAVDDGEVGGCLERCLGRTIEDYTRILEAIILLVELGELEERERGRERSVERGKFSQSREGKGLAQHMTRRQRRGYIR